jgi:hypothetical protein
MSRRSLNHHERDLAKQVLQYTPRSGGFRSPISSGGPTGRIP